ncbi:MAG: BMP family ABC transporter substrate-binding protein [Lachnospiraceae bacterium]|nr:BMP family ABC transporter substrate-binding protein [Lachnospiraceae bacterium]
MKKLTALLLTIAMVVSLSACGQTDSASASASASAQEASGETKTVKAGFICLHDENSTYDLNFINAAKEACEAMGVEYLIKTNIPEGQECYDAACELADQGCNFIFADSFGHEDFMIQAAKEFPEVQFAHATGTKAHTAGLNNFHNAFAAIYEGRYLAGIVAGMKLNEMIDNGTITADQAKMGYVGAFPYAEVVSGYTSYFLGARSVCPSATMSVVFTMSWYDETAEKESAKKLISDGCVLISQHADSMGAPTACEQAGVPNVSYNGSTASVAPNTFLVSSKINWVPYFTYAMGCVASGSAIDTDWTGTIATDSVQLTELGSAAAEGTEEAVNAAKEQFAAGTLHVFDTATFTVNGETVSSYMANVDDDPNFEGDHEAIVDGYFNESGAGFRSAPFFDLQIDGISTEN